MSSWRKYPNHVYSCNNQIHLKRWYFTFGADVFYCAKASLACACNLSLCGLDVGQRKLIYFHVGCMHHMLKACFQLGHIGSRCYGTKHTAEIHTPKCFTNHTTRDPIHINMLNTSLLYKKKNFLLTSLLFHVNICCLYLQKHEIPCFYNWVSICKLLNCIILKKNHVHYLYIWCVASIAILFFTVRIYFCRS